MCGIEATVSRSAADLPNLQPTLERRLRNRGPDYLGQVETEWQQQQPECGGGGKGRIRLRLTCSVLSLRAGGTQPDKVSRQPHVDNASGSVLCWNGEAWMLREREVVTGDGLAVLSALTQGGDVIDALRSINGPFALVFFDRPAGVLYFARDRVGRRSLLAAWSGTTLQLASVADDDDGWREVEAYGIYALHLDKWLDLSASWEQCVVRHEWAPCSNNGNWVLGIGALNTCLDAPPRTTGTYLESEAVADLRRLLEKSVRTRTTKILRPNESGSFAILFSGGLDCSVLARLANDVVPASEVIDLINVAFDNPTRRLAKNAAGDSSYEACPDRITGRKSLAELQMVCSDRAWRFIAINVTYAEACSKRSEVVSLMQPHQTEMDLSIAMALYFAARGRGLAPADTTAGAVGKEEVQSGARVLISGLGADELFGGYSRHERAHRGGGAAALLEELQLDVGRLGQRNLGRDDRVTADSGREVRFPFLDENLVRWVLAQPIWLKCDFDNNAATVEPAKRVLRLLAAELRLVSAAAEKKRAIQFGSRTARMDNAKSKGHTAIAS